ncbi:MAG: dihydroorotate dehydrogenase electron transfer subunit [Candidatus Cloacimonetes bacterium]|nr:dihydroorotate dehydrogenase electron transfer subunit [Candidatus Cloacimonadota bacterium]
MIWLKTLPIVHAQRLNAQYTVLTVEDKDLAAASHPGMFCELRAPNQEGRQFKPISIYGVEGTRLSFFIKSVGFGTDALCALQDGDTLEMMGPLGNKFPVFAGKKALLVSGGVGYPPLAWLKANLPDGTTVIHLHGGASSEDIFDCDISCTMDGSEGHQGLVTDLVLPLIQEHGINLIYSCGPVGMLKKLTELSGDIPHFVSMEAYMACGVGVCHGCVIPVGDGFQRVCKEGAVFDAKLIDWRQL